MIDPKLKDLIEDCGMVIRTKGMDKVFDGCLIVSDRQLESFARAIVYRTVDYMDNEVGHVSHEARMNVYRHLGIR